MSYLAVARFSGDDAGDFLQSQLSADILALQPGESGLACYCTPKGQVLGLLLVGCRHDSYLLAANAALLPGILRRLKMYVMRSKVLIEETAERSVEGRPGPLYGFVETVSPAGSIANWRAMELSHGVTWLNEGSSEKFIPQMLGFDQIGAVSFKKGCYPGQEIVARTRYLGKVKRRPLIVEISGQPGVQPGDKVQVLRGDAWSDAVVADLAPSGKENLVLFTVAAAEPDLPARELRCGGQTYRCATM
jgi:folate-binding protein YgfZ